MKSYHPPDWEPIPIFEDWVAGTAEQLGLGTVTTEQVGVGVILAMLVVVALLLTLRWRRAPSKPTERDPDLEAQEPAGGQRVQIS